MKPSLRWIQLDHSERSSWCIEFHLLIICWKYLHINALGISVCGVSFAVVCFGNRAMLVFLIAPCLSALWNDLGRVKSAVESSSSPGLSVGRYLLLISSDYLLLVIGPFSCFKCPQGLIFARAHGPQNWHPSRGFLIC